ncbi:DUF3576 domain-containing protein [Roseococcus pinisoli]|uniref:DUF3576 domain-containing protein n=1 Tax=Roseococcus pinisoli TaxID=2835040 RepID=A0ABS5QA85_9PROT|nr:DUF3576 domain-containing protein [Roseococcus pinisoli]MBS7810621.1 DUF3576 domain-containing protein [Roseococcus pinisoli]
MTHVSRPILVLGVGLLALAACSGGRQVRNDEYGTDSARELTLRQTGSNSSTSGIVVFGVDRSREAQGGGGTGANAGGGGMTVNAFLWRATLDTLSFMPLASADPFGGVIITDWYSPPQAEGERFKATAYVIGRQLRSDGVRVQIFRQVNRGGAWTDAPASSATNSEMEDRVLARARELRSQSAGR